MPSDSEVLKEARKELASAGGKARAAKLDPEKRSRIARKAARTRWKKPKES